MEKINIIYVDDQREVLSTISKELAEFESLVNVEECESADEALEVLTEIDDNGDFPAVLISDHIMPGKSGIDFLCDINKDPRFASTKKILLTGMATHKDTITAINSASIDRYIEKPWKSEDLVGMVKELLTRYILEKGIEYEPIMKVLDQQVLFEILRKTV